MSDTLSENTHNMFAALCFKYTTISQFSEILSQVIDRLYMQGKYVSKNAQITPERRRCLDVAFINRNGEYRTTKILRCSVYQQKWRVPNHEDT